MALQPQIHKKVPSHEVWISHISRQLVSQARIHATVENTNNVSVSNCKYGKVAGHINYVSSSNWCFKELSCLERILLNPSSPQPQSSEQKAITERGGGGE